MNFKEIIIILSVMLSTPILIGAGWLCFILLPLIALVLIFIMFAYIIYGIITTRAYEKVEETDSSIQYLINKKMAPIKRSTTHQNQNFIELPVAKKNQMNEDNKQL